ncbi:MAG: winged helix-turn-helix domain-containing protein [Sphingomonadales bacterium]|nr:winged helix-turn-helix domain-containing protein [Sphingomonadales bacterium]
MRCSHERLAGHLGTSREVVSRLVRGLAGLGLVDGGYARLTLADRPALLARARARD